MWKYFNIQSYIYRFRLLPELIDIFWEVLRSGQPIPKNITMKYSDQFKEIFLNRDPSKGLSLTKEEAYTLYSCVEATRNLGGSIAEVGVYKGGSAKIICEAKGNKPLYLFDTFEGMPAGKISKQKDAWAANTHIDTSIDRVTEYLGDYPEINFVKGEFPESLNKNSDLNLKEKSFCFVHLDVDLYESTLLALEFFYPRLVPSGRIVSHNYNLSQLPGGDIAIGVKTAFKDYFKGRDHLIIEIADTQCLVIKPD